ncbi:MAG: MBL fold metallo-hydrolase [Methanobacteriota archaeon]
MTGARIRLFGGVNEIGGNKFLLEDGEDRLLLDFGTNIADRNLFFEMPFLTPRNHTVVRDLLRLGLLPPIDGLYRHDFLHYARTVSERPLPMSAAEHRERSGRPLVHGILLTHAHVDHFQDLSFVDPSIPVYCTPTTRRMLRAIEDVKSADAESEVLDTRTRTVGQTTDRSTFPGLPACQYDETPRRVVELEEGAPQRIGGFDVTAVPVDHSVPGACAFYVRTPSGRTVFYTGDVRFHGRLVERTQTLLKAIDGLAPDVLLCEGTRMASENRDSEADVERGVAELVADAKGLVVAEFGWKDTTRFDTLAAVARETGRTLLVDPRLAYLLTTLADRDDVPSKTVPEYEHVNVYVRRRKSMLDQPHDYEKFEAGDLADWGKQGKDMGAAWRAGDEGYLAGALRHFRNGVRAASVREHPERYLLHLTYYGANELFDLEPPAGSRWIRCTTEPYSDEMAFDLDRQRRWLDLFGLAHNLPGRKDGSADPGVLRTAGRVTHVSGHGAGPDLSALVKAARPKLLVPVHTNEECLDRFEDLGSDTALFRGATYREAGRGECVVEF